MADTIPTPSPSVSEPPPLPAQDSVPALDSAPRAALGPALGPVPAIVLAGVGALGLLGLVDLLGTVVAGYAGASGPEGLIVSLAGGLPAPVGAWLASLPAVLTRLEGVGGLALLALVVAACWHGVARGNVARVAGALDCVALLVAGAWWAFDEVGSVVVGQALFLILAGLVNRGRGPHGGAVVPGVTQAARLLGLVAAVLLVGTSPQALSVAVVIAALAPWALVRLLFGRMAALPVKARVREPKAEAEAAPSSDSGPSATGSEASSENLTGASESGPGGGSEGGPEGNTVVDEPSRPVGLAMPQVDADEAEPSPGDAQASGGAFHPFGADLLADQPHLVPAARLIESAQKALDAKDGAILSVIRVDGLAGIAEHLGESGGQILFAEASRRLADALPQMSLLVWMGDETFAALVVVPGTMDEVELDGLLESLGEGMAASFAAEVAVEGRAISMEDAIHVEVTLLQPELMPELARWVAAAPGA